MTMPARLQKNLPTEASPAGMNRRAMLRMTGGAAVSGALPEPNVPRAQTRRHPTLRPATTALLSVYRTRCEGTLCTFCRAFAGQRLPVAWPGRTCCAPGTKLISGAPDSGGVAQLVRAADS